MNSDQPLAGRNSCRNHASSGGDVFHALSAHRGALVNLNLLRHVVRATHAWAHSRPRHGHCLSERLAFICRGATGPRSNANRDPRAEDAPTEPFAQEYSCWRRRPLTYPRGTRTFVPAASQSIWPGEPASKTGRTINSCVFFPIDRYVSRFKWIAG